MTNQFRDGRPDVTDIARESLRPGLKELSHSRTRDGVANRSNDSEPGLHKMRSDFDFGGNKDRSILDDRGRTGGPVCGLRGPQECEVCEALWWNGEGKYDRYTDQSIGLKKWNHRGSKFLSLVLLLLYIGLVVLDAVYYVIKFWGKKGELLRYISYMSYIIFVGNVPLICMYGILRNPGPKMARFSHWTRTMDMRYIVRRLQYLELGKHGLPNRLFLALCIVFPLGITTFKAYFYFGVINVLSVHSYLTLMTMFVGLSTFGAFCYFLYLMRVAFPPQLKLDVAFIQRHINQLDACRGKLAVTIQDFRSLRQLTGGWMVMIASVMTWSIATQIVWNYVLIGEAMKNETSSGIDPHALNLEVQKYINILITLQNITFILLPCIAVGGFDMNEMWVRFRHRLMHMQRERHDLFWYRLFKCMSEQEPVANSVRATMYFTLIGLFVALQVGDQNVLFNSSSS